MLTFIDSGVLIAAARINDPASARAGALLNDPGRTFVSSEFVRLEVLPKATYHKRTQEVTFYDMFFDSVQVWVPVDDVLVRTALVHATTFGLSAVDALHVAAAELAHAAELITSERATSPLLRVNTVRVISLHP